MNLQQILYFTLKDAITDNAENSPTGIYAINAKKTYDEYFVSRTQLRTHIDSIVAKAHIFLDLPRNPNRSIDLDETKTDPLPFVASNRNRFISRGFNCKLHMPIITDKTHITEFGQPLPTRIDWLNLKHHVLTFYFCLEDIHYKLFVVRTWASTGKLDNSAKTIFNNTRNELEQDIDLQVDRLIALSELSTRRIEDFRLRDRPAGFLCHQLSWACEH